MNGVKYRICPPVYFTEVLSYTAGCILLYMYHVHEHSANAELKEGTFGGWDANGYFLTVKKAI